MLVLKTLTVLSDQKNHLAVRVVCQFFLELLACKPKRNNGGQKSEVVSNLYGVAGCKQ